MTNFVSAIEVERNFEMYHDRALGGEAICVTKAGHESVYIMSAQMFHELSSTQRQAISTADLGDAEMALIEAAEIPHDQRYDLNGK